jgi:hypothetical protein
MKRKFLGIGIVFLVICCVIATLEGFNVHPQINIGRFHSIWVGVRHMEFLSGTMTTPTAGGEKVIQREFDLGPVKLAIEYP